MHAEEEHENDERWLLTYADMITLLMALFMVLFSISSVNISKFVSLQHSLQDAFSGRILPGGRALQESGGSTTSPQVAATPAASTPAATNEGADRKAADAAAKAQATAEERDFKALKERVDAYAREHGLESKVTTLITKDGLVIRLLTDKLLFASGSATVQPGGRGLLAKIGGMLRAESEHAIRVRGFTDTVPIHTAEFPSNWELSAARATAVLRQLLEAGLPPDRVSVAGYGEQEPVAGNATAAGRAQNRRVEIVVLRQFTAETLKENT